MPFNLNGLLADYHYISQDDKAKRDATKRAAAADEASKPKASSGGFSLGDMLGNVLGGVGNTALDVAKSATPYDLIKDTVQGHPQDIIADRMKSVNNVISGRHIAENFGGEQQFNRLPDVAQTAVDVAPAAGIAAATGGASTIPGLGGAFLKSLALNTGINLGLQKGSEAAQDVPGWGNLPEEAQQAAIMAGTVGLGHLAGKGLSRPGQTAEASYRPFPEEPLDPRVAELAGIKSNERPTDPKFAAIHDAVYNPDSLGPGLSELGNSKVEQISQQLSNHNAMNPGEGNPGYNAWIEKQNNLIQQLRAAHEVPAIQSDSFADLRKQNELGSYAATPSDNLLQAIQDTNIRLQSEENPTLEDQSNFQQMMQEASKRGIDVPSSVQKGQVVQIAGGASRWAPLFKSPISSLNSTLRAGHVLFDLASWGRLGPQVALYKPGEFASAMKASAQSLYKGRAPVIDTWNKIDAESAASGGQLPTVADWRKSGLSLHTPSTGALSQVPGLRNVAGMYQNFLDTLRPLVANEELRNRLMSGKVAPGDPNAIKQIARGTNLLTGKSSAHLGGEADLLMEFPNWIAAQGEMILKASASGQIDGQMARASLARLVGLGTLVTYAVNAAQEGTPNPARALTAHTRNAIPQLQIPGTDIQLDMYGPLGELISKTLGIGARGAQEGPSGAAAALGDTYRSFASPIAKIGINQLTKSTQFGERVSTPEERILDLINNALPFSTAEASHVANQVPGVSVPKSLEGTRSGTADVLGNLGLRVHEPSPIVRALSDAGISQSDPDYLIKRKDYLQQHPELRTTNDVTDLQNEIQASRRELSNQLTAPGSTLDLVHFRDERTKILQKQRDVLGVLLGPNANASLGDTPQAKWLSSYNKLFADSKDPKSPSGAINRQLLDENIAKWVNDPANGQAGLDFVNRYTGTGLSPAEAAYIGDLRKLDQAGYFTTMRDQRYVHLQSSLTPDQIDAYKAEAESHRLAKTNKASMAEVLHQLHPNLTSKELGDIVHAGSQSTANPELEAFKAKHAKELLWFNPRATWETYQAAQDNPNAPRNLPATNTGLVKPGNIDTSKLPAVNNPDGSVSTVRTISVGTDAGEVLIPTVINGRVVSNEEALQHYHQTGENLGTYRDVASANAAAQKLHQQEATRIGR